MRALIFCPDRATASEVSVACSVAGVACESFPSLQELGAQLYRDPEAVGVIWAGGWSGAVEICRGFREASVSNPLLVIMPGGGVKDRAVRDIVFVLGAGADDCQHEPLDGREIAARIIALHRRERDHAPTSFKLPGGAVYTPDKSVVEKGGRIVNLTGQENRLLDLLASRPGICVTKAMCMLALYDHQGDAQPKIIDVFICKLRRKLAPLMGGLDFLETVWGQGYRFIPGGFESAVVDFRKRVAAR